MDLGDEAKMIAATAAMIDSLRRLRRTKPSGSDKPAAKKRKNKEPDLGDMFADFGESLLDVVNQMTTLIVRTGAEQWRIKARIAELAGEGADEVARCLAEAQAIESQLPRKDNAPSD